MAVVEIHQVPVRYAFKSTKQGIKDILHMSEFIHMYLQDGGDPRRVHFACPELKCLNQNITMSTKITNDNTEVQKTTFPVILRKDEEVSDA